MDLTIFIIPAIILSIGYFIKVVGKVYADVKTAKESKKLLKSINGLYKKFNPIIDKYLNNLIDDE